MYNINSILIAIFGLIKTKPLEGSATANGGGLMWKSVTCRIKRGNITLKREREREKGKEKRRKIDSRSFGCVLSVGWVLPPPI